MGFSPSGQKLDNKFERTQESFTMEWQQIKEYDSAWGWSVEQRLELLLDYMEVSRNDLKEKMFLDCGCGHGEVTLAVGKTGASYYGLDLSFSVDYIHNLIKMKFPELLDRIYLVQGNVNFPPFKENSFDFVHSSGVLHHTPDTLEAFKSIEKLVKYGGKTWIWVYKKRGRMFELIIGLLRRITTRLPLKLLALICWTTAIPVYFLYKYSNTFKTRTYRETFLSQFDCWSPQYQFHHTIPEVFGWYNYLGYKELKANLPTRNGFGVLGTKDDAPV